LLGIKPGKPGWKWTFWQSHDRGNQREIAAQFPAAEFLKTARQRHAVPTVPAFPAFSLGVGVY